MVPASKGTGGTDCDRCWTPEKKAGRYDGDCARGEPGFQLLLTSRRPTRLPRLTLIPLGHINTFPPGGATYTRIGTAAPPP